MDNLILYRLEDYRSVLRAWLGGRGRSQTTLARRIGVSRSMISMVLACERDLPLAQARAWGGGLGLSEEQLGYFEALVRAEVGETLALRRAARMHVSATREYHQARRPTHEESLALVGRWFVPVLLELARVGALRDEASSLASLLWPPVDVEELEKTLAELVERGVLRREGDRWTVDGSLATDRDVGPDLAEAVGAYHAAQLEHARLSLERWDRDLRHVGSLVVAVPEDCVSELAAALHRFHLDVIEPHRRVGDGPVRLVQVSVQLFPRTSRAVDGSG